MFGIVSPAGKNETNLNQFPLHGVVLYILPALGITEIFKKPSSVIMGLSL